MRDLTLTGRGGFDTMDGLIEELPAQDARGLLRFIFFWMLAEIIRLRDENKMLRRESAETAFKLPRVVRTTSAN